MIDLLCGLSMHSAIIKQIRLTSELMTDRRTDVETQAGHMENIETFDNSSPFTNELSLPSHSL
jgi:hypothetical protein